MERGDDKKKIEKDLVLDSERPWHDTNCMK